jgi:hypothetical protein
MGSWEELLRPHHAKFRSAFAGGLHLTLEPHACDVLGRLMMHMAKSLDVLGHPVSNALPIAPDPEP